MTHKVEGHCACCAQDGRHLAAGAHSHGGHKDQDSREHDHQDGCSCGHEHGQDGCSCDHEHGQDDGCGCGHVHGQDDGCGCGHVHGQDDGCGCGHEHGKDGCSCGHEHGQDDGCGCGHVHGRTRDAGEQRVALVRLALTVLCAVGGYLVPGLVGTLAYFVAYLVAGYDVLLRALQNIRKGRIFDENFLMAVASLSALLLGEHAEAVAVMLFYQIGEAFQDRAIGKSRTSIASLLDIRPEAANVVVGDEVITRKPTEVAVGDIIQVKPGERIPLDGVVLQGHATLDTSALTGESLPREVTPGEDVLSGCINRDGLLTLRVTRAYGESTVSKILDMVQNASEKKTRTEQFITRFARVYTPIVVLGAVLLSVIPPLVLPGAQFADWLHRGLTFLVVSCPCALVISVPLGYFGGIGAASRAGILCKGSDALDALCDLRTLVLDKTGTLTQGKFSLTKQLPAPGVAAQDLLLTAATAEQISNHPIAESVRLAASDLGPLPAVADAQEITGHGVRVTSGDHVLLAGNEKLLAREGIAGIQTLPHSVGSVVYVARDGQYLGALVVSDALKADSAAAVAELGSLGVSRMVMLTGDRAEVAQAVAAQVGIQETQAQLLPAQKMEHLERILAVKSQGKTGFVGDGINDAPVLARADVGIAMGGLGADAAIEAADIVLMNDQLSKIAVGIRIARKTRQIVQQNIVFSLGIKAVVLALSAFGYANMWAAVFADVGVSIIAIMNATRTMRFQKRG